MVSICINHIVGVTCICVPSLSICQGRSVIITDFLLPTLGLYLQSTEVQLQLITVRIRSADEASLVGCVEVCGCHISIITATHQFIIYDNTLREIKRSLLSVNLHTTHITTTIDRTEIGWVWDIVVRITIRLFCKHNAGNKRHGYTFHVGGECFGICQVNRVELWPIACYRGVPHGAQYALLRMFRILFMRFHHVLAIVAEEQIIDNSIGAYLQLHLGVVHAWWQWGTVTTAIDGTVNDCFLGFRTLHIDRHLLGVWTVIIESLHRGLSCRNSVIQVAVCRVIF